MLINLTTAPATCFIKILVRGITESLVEWVNEKVCS